MKENWNKHEIIICFRAAYGLPISLRLRLYNNCKSKEDTHTQKETPEGTPSGNDKSPLITSITIYNIYTQHLSLTCSKFRPCSYHNIFAGS